MLERRWPTTVWRGASATAEMKWLGGEGAVAPAWSSGDSDELGELHGLGAWLMQRMKSTALLELRARTVTRRSSGGEAEDGARSNSCRNR
jgi:hypothetical protein